MKNFYYLLFIFFLTGCFARGGDLDGTSVGTIIPSVNSSKVNYGGYVRADSEVVFSFVSPSINPVSGVLITIEETGESCKTNSYGYFNFLNLEPGTYHINGFRHLPDGDYFKFRKEIILSSGINSQNNEFTLKKCGGISGELLLGSINSRDVHIEISPENEIISPSYNGTYFFPQLVEGTYSITFYREGYIPMKIGNYYVPSGGIIQIPKSSPPMTPISIIVKTLKVNLYDTQKSPLNGVKVKLINLGKMSYSNNGEVYFSNIQNDTVEINCSMNGYKSQSLSVILNNIDNSQNIIMEKSLSYISPKLILHVKDNSGNNLEGVIVTPVPELDSSYTDNSGNTILYLSEATYEIEIEKSGYEQATLSVFIKNNNSFTSEVILNKKTLPPFYEINGKVINSETTLGQEGSWVTDDKFNFATQTDKNGEFTLKLPAGNYRLNSDYLTFFKGYEVIIVNGNLSGIEIYISR